LGHPAGGQCLCNGFRRDSPGTNAPRRRRKSLISGPTYLHMPRLPVISARSAAEMRKSPQSKKPLHIDFSAPPHWLAEMRMARRVGVNLTGLRGIRKMPTGRNCAVSQREVFLRNFTCLSCTAVSIVSDRTRGDALRIGSGKLDTNPLYGGLRGPCPEAAGLVRNQKLSAFSAPLRF